MTSRDCHIGQPASERSRNVLNDELEAYRAVADDFHQGTGQWHVTLLVYFVFGVTAASGW